MKRLHWVCLLAGGVFVAYVLSLKAPDPIVHDSPALAAPVNLEPQVISPQGVAEKAPVLKMGMSGPQVSDLQKKLNKLVWNVCFAHVDSRSDNGELCSKRYKITVDGQFGAETEEAVIMFQRQQDLEPDGIVGGKTWKKILDPDRPCVIPKRVALALGATEREANYIALIAWRESRCHLHQMVDRPRTRDYSWGPYGVNYYGKLMDAQLVRYGPPVNNITSWRWATEHALAAGRRDGWCHWYKSPTQFYCRGPLYGPGDPPPSVEAPN